ncbi:MAG: hypothetical protein ACR2JE_12555 [Acidobacteriaceae bacterium]
MQVFSPVRLALMFVVLAAAFPQNMQARDSLAKYAGVYHGETRTREETRGQSREPEYATRHHTITLTLGKDGSATLTESPDAVSETTRFAHWSYADGQITLRFDPLADGTTPAQESYSVNHHELTPVVWDHRLWKTLPPPKLERE